MANFYETEWEEPELDTLPSLAHHLVYRLNGCDDRIVRLTLQEVYRDFCRRSCCLRVRRHFDFEPDGNYLVTPMFGGEVERIVAVYDGCLLLREGRDYTVSGNILHLRRGRHNVPPPNPPPEERPHGLTPESLGYGRLPFDFSISWIEMPSLASEKVPRWLLKKHGDTICAGVMARLTAMSNRPWSDPQMAAIESNRYEAALNAECQKLYAVGDSGNLGNVFDTSDLI